MNESALRSILVRLNIQVVNKSRKGWLDFHCPLAPYTHAKGYDRSASAGALVNDEGVSSWVCHTCKSHGRISRLIADIQTYTGRTFPGLMREADTADVMASIETNYGDFETVAREIEPEPLEEAAYAQVYQRASEVPDALGYLRERRISAAVADDLDLQWEPRQRRILFPVRDLDGRLFGFSGRAIDRNPEWPKIRDYAGLPKRHLILGAHRWKQGKPVIVVEGLFGYAHLVSIGVEAFANVGALLGSVLTPEKATILRSFDEPVYLLLDNDDAGDVGIFGRVLPSGGREGGAVEQLQAYIPVGVPEWPEGKDDPDQLTLEEVKNMVEQTPWS